MDIVSSDPWLCEPGTEDPMIFHEFEMNYFDNEFSAEEMAILLEDFHPSHSLTFENNSSSLNEFPPTTYPLLTNANDSSLISTTNQQKPDSHPTVISFSPNNHQKEDASSSSDMDLCSGAVMHHDSANQDPTTKNSQTRKRRASRAPAESRDHIMAERKRRERISEKFIALSALVPGLKKTDKTSVLGEAIKYTKQLQERVKILEEEVAMRAVESVIIVKKSRVVAEDDGRYDSCSNGYLEKQPLPEIEAKFSDKKVLLKIHCEKHKGGIVKVLSEIEKLHLSIVNVLATPFTHTTLDLTVVAQMEKALDMTPEYIVRGLRSALEHF